MQSVNAITVEVAQLQYKKLNGLLVASLISNENAMITT